MILSCISDLITCVICVGWQISEWVCERVSDSVSGWGIFLFKNTFEVNF